MGNIKIILFFLFLPRILFSANIHDGIFVEAEEVKKRDKMTILSGNVMAKTTDFVLTTKRLMVNENENEYVADHDVIIKLKNKDITIKCWKCIYNIKEKHISFFDVKIYFDNTVTFTTQYCDFRLDTNCLTYDKYGEIEFEGNILSSKNGKIAVKDEEIFLNKDVRCENEHLLLHCQYFHFKRKDGKATFNEGISINFKKIKDLRAIVKKQVIYDTRAETFTTDNLIVINKKAKGFFSSAISHNKKNKIILYDGIIKNEENYIICEEISYDIKNQELILEKKPISFLQNGITFISNDLHIKIS